VVGRRGGGCGKVVVVVGKKEKTHERGEGSMKPGYEIRYRYDTALIRRYKKISKIKIRYDKAGIS